MYVDYHKRLIPVVRYLEKHFNEPLNLIEVAALANFSPYHFHRTFKAVQGETLADFIRRLRLESAADDLFKSKQPVLNIALEYGFSSSQRLDTRCARMDTRCARMETQQPQAIHILTPNQQHGVGQ